MPPGSTMLTFIGASLALIALPGPNGIYIVTRSATGGRRAGLISAAGVESATLVHIAVSGLGLSALIAGSATAYTVVALAGAGYLIYLAVRTLRAPVGVDHGIGEASTAQTSMRRIYLDGVLVNLLNPKVTLFFLAFLPQFVTPHAAPAAVRGQLLALGGLFFLVALGCDVAYALVGAALGGRLSSWPAQRYVTATIYLALGGYAVAGLFLG